MNLVIDSGNTSVKLAVFDGRKKTFSSRAEELTSVIVAEVLDSHTITKAVISAVRIIARPVISILEQKTGGVHYVTYRSKLPFTMEYETPQTLGSDRIAAVAGAYELFPGSNILVIDAGTAITYEYLYGETWAGGNISPGIEMRFRALHEFTAQLPLVKDSGASYSSPGKNTTEALMAGVIDGVSYEINEYIRTFLKNNTQGKVILTGGDGKILREKTGDAVLHVPDLVIDGLNYILEYNAR